MTLQELEQIRESLKECGPDVEDFSWGPSLSFAENRRKEALKIINRAIKECKTNNMVHPDEIPQGIIDELNSKFKIVLFSNYGQPINGQCRTVKFHHREIIKASTSPETAETTAIMYIACGIFKEDSADIFSILNAGIIRIQGESV